MSERIDLEGRVDNLDNPLQRKIIARINDPHYVRFSLDKSFVSQYGKLTAPFGFDGLGEVVYLRTYSRPTKEGKNERWLKPT